MPCLISIAADTGLILASDNTLTSKDETQIAQRLYDVRSDTVASASGKLIIESPGGNFDLMRTVRRFFDKQGGIIPHVLPDLQKALTKETSAFLQRTAYQTIDLPPDGFFYSVQVDRIAPGLNKIDSARITARISATGVLSLRTESARRTTADNSAVHYLGEKQFIEELRDGKRECDAVVLRMLKKSVPISETPEEAAVHVAGWILRALAKSRERESNFDICILDYISGFRWIEKQSPGIKVTSSKQF